MMKEEKASHRTQNITESLANNSYFRSVLSKLKFIRKFCWQVKHSRKLTSNLKLSPAPPHMLDNPLSRNLVEFSDDRVTILSLSDMKDPRPVKQKLFAIQIEFKVLWRIVVVAGWIGLFL